MAVWGLASSRNGAIYGMSGFLGDRKIMHDINDHGLYQWPAEYPPSVDLWKHQLLFLLTLMGPQV